MYLYESTEQRIKKLYPNRLVLSYMPYRSHYYSRYIQISTPFGEGDNFAVHYELLGGSGSVELHFEFDRDRDPRKQLISYLRKETLTRGEEFVWEPFDVGFRCKFHRQATEENLTEVLKEFTKYFDDLIEKYLKRDTAEHEACEVKIEHDFSEQIEAGIEVGLHTLTLGELLSHNLAIPDYQRIYCWEERQVNCLLEDLHQHLSSKPDCPYRLGTIILHRNGDKYDIIDGQQRLVTLSLLLLQLRYDKSPLLDQKFYATQSRKYIAYNRYLIQSFCQCPNRINIKATALLNRVEFSVLLLRSPSLDLAYTFFSSHNARGMKLSDYDLLKAHHLRHITKKSDAEVERIATRWNRMIEQGHRDKSEGKDIEHVRLLDTYLYRLRRWLQHEACDEHPDNHHIKNEFEAAPIIEDIPPEGESCHINAPIQGGEYFFTYVWKHLIEYKKFANEIEPLRRTMTGGGSVGIYRDVIESLCFAYYLKFGTNHFAEALLAIMRIVLQHRYDNRQARKESILRYVGESKLCQWIDRATSPTFFLAAARNRCEHLEYPITSTPIQDTMRTMALKIELSLEKELHESFKQLY